MTHEPTGDRRETDDIIEDLELRDTDSDQVTGGALGDAFLTVKGTKGEGTAPTSGKIDTLAHIPLGG